jgi:hypothetical protein
MSSLRAIDLPSQRTERLQPIASPTEAYRPLVGPRPTPRAELLEHGIRVIARLGFSPTPSILLVSALAIVASFRTT